MRKFIAPLLLIVAIAAVSASAQSGGARGQNAGGLTNQEKMIPFALGMALGVLHEMHDDTHYDVAKMIGSQIRYYGDELEPVLALKPNTTDYVRADVVLTAIKKLRDKSSKPDKWKMLAGDYFGSIYASLRKHANDGDEINVDDLRFDIEMIGALANNAPEQIPSEFVDAMKEFAKLKDLRDIDSDASIKKMTTAVGKILDSIED